MPSTTFASAATASLRTLVLAADARSANDVAKTLRTMANSVAKTQFRVGGVSFFLLFCF